MYETITYSLRLVYYLRNPKLMRTLERELLLKLAREMTTPRLESRRRKNEAFSKMGCYGYRFV